MIYSSCTRFETEMQTYSVTWEYARGSSSEVVKPVCFSSTLNSIHLPLYLIKTVTWFGCFVLAFFYPLPSTAQGDYFSGDVIVFLA